jgi:16S rRNA (uracil1498-N3)-methyltransferase
VSSEQIEGDCLQLTSDQYHYLQRVLRLREGDRFLALNGQGDVWLATIAGNAQAHLATAASASADFAGQPRIILAACLPKQGFDEVVRQVTELGVDEIVPIISDRTLLRPSPNKLQRWRRIAAEAGEQAERLTVPTVRDPFAWSDWLTAESPNHRYLCVARQEAPSLLAVCLATPIDAIEVAIGPEGGWTETEIDAAIAQGYQLVTLGQSILRAVTASVTALSILRAGFDFATIYQSKNV